MNIGGGDLSRTEMAVGQITNRNQTLTEQLDGRKKDLESRLDEVNRALEALKKNPGIEEILNLISRIRY